MINSPMAVTEAVGSVFALVAHDTVLYAGRANGLFASRDSGASWHLVPLGEPENTAVMSSAVSQNRLFIGTKGAVLRSDDAGANWHIAGLALPPPLVTALCVSPNFNHDGVVLAGTAEDGVFVSRDGGSTWTAWNFGLIDWNVNALLLSPHFSSDSTVFAGTESGVFSSADGGRKWRETPFPMDAAPVLSLAIAHHRLFAGTDQQGLWVSDDVGSTWQPISDEHCTSPIHALHTDDTHVWLLTDDKLVGSPDAGHTWHKKHDFLPHQTALSLLVDGARALIGFAEGDILQVQL
jgi:photosystem II stability/assembly factor-like uncharacterized protein